LSSLNVPGLHILHASFNEIPVSLDPSVPAGHSLHFYCSVLSLYVPIIHFLHLVCPLISCYVPLGQSLGSSNPISEH